MKKIWYVILFVTFFLLVSLDSRPSIQAASQPPHPKPNQEKAMDGLTYELSETPTKVSASSPDRTTLAPARSLPAAEARPLLDRLPPLKTEARTREFSFPPESPPAPRPGRTLTEPFPPKEAQLKPETPFSGPLEVRRRAPEGEVLLAPEVSLTFSQPMIDLTGREDTAAGPFPARLNPQPAGTWRWVGTRTLTFEPQGRMPMATEYLVEVPAQTTSATGGRLPVAVSWRFATPAPTVVHSRPVEGPVDLQPIIFLSFDQAVDPAAVLATVKLTAGGRAYPLRLAEPAEIQKNDEVATLVRETVAGRWLACRPLTDLPTATKFTVQVGPGTPSAEGPRKTTNIQEFIFRTYGPLKVSEHRCGWGQECWPTAPWAIDFTNPLDLEAFDPGQIKVTPEVSGLMVDASGGSLTIRGYTQGRTKYKVHLNPGIKDQYGQTLGRETILPFEVGSARPVFFAPGGDFLVLDPAGPAKYPIFSINYSQLRVRLFTVQPEDYLNYLHLQTNRFHDDRDTLPPGRLVWDKTVAVKGQPDQLVETSLDLAPALKDGLGQVIIQVEPVTDKPVNPDDFGQSRQLLTWVQCTRLGLDVWSDQENMVVWANSLADGRPLAGVEVGFHGGRQRITTGPDGLARLPLPTEEAARLLVGRLAGDVAILREGPSFHVQEGWQRTGIRDALRYYVFDDRQMYRPGEEARIKGWVRLVGGGPTGDVGSLPDKNLELDYRLEDARRNEMAKGRVKLGPWGGFDLTIKLPDRINLGPARLVFSAPDLPEEILDREYEHTFQVQEFRRPEFEVQARVSAGPHLVGGSATLSVAAKYFAGGGLADAETHWLLTASPGQFTPPGWDRFSFGQWRPWWLEGREEGGIERSRSFDGRTDATGNHDLRLDFTGVDPPRPTSLTAEATVMDVNRQAWTATTRLLVHPARYYVGLRSEKTFVDPGQPLAIEAIVTDLDGKPVGGVSLALTAVREDWRMVKGQWREVETEAGQVKLASSTQPVTHSFTFQEGGTYRIAARIADPEGRVNETMVTRWVSGGKRPPSRQLEQEEVTLIPGRQEYRPGDMAEILIQAPFSPAEGLVTLQRSGLVETQRISLTGPTHTLKIPIVEAYIPNLTVAVDLVGAAPRVDDQGRPTTGLPPRPALAHGSLNLVVPAHDRSLSLEVRPANRELEPGAQTSVEVLVKDAAGRSVSGGEVALMVVDEAILALTGYNLDDPVEVFYRQRAGEVSSHHSRLDVLLFNPDKLLEAVQRNREDTSNRKYKMAMDLGAAMPEVSAPMAMLAPPSPAPMPGGGGSPGPEPIKVRLDFNPLAAFAPSVTTDAQGRATLTFKLPDNLTRYRIMAVAVAGGKQFGLGEETITARLPLLVRPSAPRFLNFGDKFELPVVLQNQTDAPLETSLVVRAANAELTAGNARLVTVPARDRVEVRFPATTVEVGTAVFQIGASAGTHADAAEVKVPVYTPATAEAAAVYGELDDGAVLQPVKAPAEAWPQFGGLEISTGSTALQALTDAVLYLVRYPFECSEQMASRVLSVAALKDVLAAFKAEGLPPADEIADSVTRDLDKLAAMQNDDGGFPIWRRGQDSWPYHSIHVMHALARAQARGWTPPAATMDRGLYYLKQVEKHFPKEYPERVRWSLTAYALYVRNLLGDVDPAGAGALFKKSGGPEKLDVEASSWLLGVMGQDPKFKKEAADLRRFLGNRITETAAAASVVTSYGDGGYLLLHSNRRTDAVVLETLIKDQPNSDLIPKLVRGLLAHRKQGRWASTQENAFVLLALDAYFRTFEAVTPNFVVRAWLGDRYVGQAQFHGRGTDDVRIDVPLPVLAGTGRQEILLSKEGPGRFYYRLGLRYAPKELNLKPVDQGFTVTRTFEPVDDPGDVKRDQDGTWRIKAGARVRVRLGLSNEARRYHVALIDPLPAGFEPLNPDLAVTGGLPTEKEKPSGLLWWFWGPWYEHQNLRDDRVEAFASLLWEGGHEYTYLTRATTPGRFIAPPTRAEEMYSPETFGRCGTTWVVVE